MRRSPDRTWRSEVQHSSRDRASSLYGHLKVERLDSIWLSPQQVLEKTRASIFSVPAERFFDAEQAIVFREAFRSGDGANLYLRRPSGNGKVRHRSVLGLPRPRADDRAVPVPPRQFNQLQRLGQRSNLIHFNKDGMGHAGLNPLPEPVDVRHKQVVAQQLATTTELASQDSPAFPVLFSQAILD